MSSKYDKSPVKRGSDGSPYAYTPPPERVIRQGFRVIRIAPPFDKSYHAETDSWVPVEKGTIYVAYEIAYQSLVMIANRQIGQYEVRSI